MPAGRATYEKPRGLLTDNERACVDTLVRNGLSPVVRRKDPNAAANIDLEIDGEPGEMKNVTSESSASNQIKRARVKWMKLGIERPMKAVFTTEGSAVAFDELADAVVRRGREGEEPIVISQDGALQRTQ